MNKEPETFTSNFSVKTAYPIKIPFRIFEVCTYLSKQDNSNEFAIIVKASNTGEGYVLTEDFIVPEQTVSSASVDFDNIKLVEYRAQGYNTVIHFHPMNLTKFSSTDDRYINNHFDVSILFCNGDFTDSIVNITINGIHLQLKGEITMQTPDMNINLQNIKKNTSVAYNVTDWEKWAYTKYGIASLDYDHYPVYHYGGGSYESKEQPKNRKNKREAKLKWKLP